MLQSTRNKETMDILKRLRQKGAPAPSVPADGMDMAMGQEDMESETVSPDMVVTDLSIPGVPSNKKKKPKPAL